MRLYLKTCRVGLKPSQPDASVNGCCAFVFYALLLMNGGFCRLVKIHSVILKTQHTFQVNPMSIDADSVPKCRWMDGQTAFQLYNYSRCNIYYKETDELQNSCISLPIAIVTIPIHHTCIPNQA